MALPIFTSAWGKVSGVKAAGKLLGAPLVVSSYQSGQAATSPYTPSDSLIRAAMKANETVFSCMNFRSKSVAEAPLVVMEEEEPNLDHDFSKLFARPNPYWTQAQLWQYVVYQLDSAVNGAFIFAPRASVTGKPVELWPKPSSDVRIIKDSDRFIRGFQYRVGGNWIDVPEEVTVVWLRYVDAEDLWSSWPPLLAASRSIGTDTEKERFLAYLFENMAVIPGFFSTTANLDEQAFERTKQTLLAMVQGATNAGKPAFLDNGFRYEKMGLGLQELDFGTLDDRLVTKICAAFGIPPIVVNALVGVSSSSNLGGDKVKQAKAQAYDDTIIPIWKMLAESVGVTIGPYFGLEVEEVQFDLSDVQALQDDMEAQFRMAASATGFAKVDEQRELVGWEPLEDDKGQYVLPLEQAISLGMIEDLKPEPDEDEEMRRVEGEELALESQRMQLQAIRGGKPMRGEDGADNEGRGAAGAR